MKTIALALLIAVPSSGWAQVVNGPGFPQSDAPIATSLLPRDQPPGVEVTAPPLYQRWYFWAGTAAVVTGIVVSSVLVAMAMSKPRQINSRDICGAQPCDACIGIACP